MRKQLRDNKNCLNCGATVDDRFCPRCGQENIVIEESLGHLISHFFQDFTHYDSKFLLTIKALLGRPGLLTREYLAGKRASYLHPIRLYIFVSFIYFLLLLSVQHTGTRVEEEIIRTASQATRQQITDSLRNWLRGHHYMNAKGMVKDTLASSLFTIVQGSPNSFRPIPEYVIIGNITYKDLLAFDSLQKTLPPGERKKGPIPWLYGRWLAGINHYGDGIIPLVEERTQHFVPKMMFLLLPLFALLLKLFYNKKKYFYVDHAIFSLHYHAAVFLIFLFFAMLGLVFPSGSNFFGLVQFFIALVYLIAALRKVYCQSLPVSILKGVALALLYSIFILLGYAVLAISALTFT